MSWKDMFLIWLIVGAVVIASVERHFFHNVLLVISRLIAVAHIPGFLHFVYALVR